MKSSYTHAVFPKDKNSIAKHSLHDVSFAILQVKQLCSSEEHIVGLLWVLEFLKRPQKGFFNNPKREMLKEALVELQVLANKNGEYVLDPVLSDVLRMCEVQNQLSSKAFSLIQNTGDFHLPKNEDSDEESSSEDKYEVFASTITISLEFWDQVSGRYSNPDNIPDSVLKIRVGKSTYEFLKTLKWWCKQKRPGSYTSRPFSRIIQLIFLILLPLKSKNRMIPCC